jgi:hypothetical protein
MTLPPRSAPALLLLCGALAPSLALAGDAVVPPLVGKAVDPLVVLNMTSLISSELDFMGKFDNVTQLDAMPAGMNLGCLSSASCLGGVAKASGVGAVVAGSVEGKGGGFALSLTLFEDGKIVRTKNFTLPTTPSVIADSMGGYVKELVTGTSSAQEAKAESLGAFEQKSAMALLDDDDDLEIAGPGKAAPAKAAPAAAGKSTSRSSSFDDLPEDEDPDDAAMRAEEERAAAARAKADADNKARAAAEAKAKAEAEARRQEEAAAKAKAEAEARRKAEAEAKAQAEAKRKAEAEAAAEAKRKADAEAKARATARSAPAEEDFEINFGSATDSIQVEEISFGSAVAMIQVDEDEEEDAAPAPVARSSSGAKSASMGSSSRSSSSSSSARTSSSRPSSSDDLDLLDDEPVSSRRSSLDEDEDEVAPRSSSRSSSSSSSSKSSASRSSSSRSSFSDLDDEPSSSRSSSSRSSGSSYRDLDEPARSGGSKDRVEYSESDASLTGRIGYAPFEGLDFVTYGVELAYMATTNLAIAGGIEAYSVKRTIPPALLDEGEPAEQWNTILPINFGLQGRFGQGVARPYVGADVVLIPGYVKEAGGVAVGGRGRLGLDLLLSDGFGLNLNGALGVWSGENFSQVQEGVSGSGLSPQISAGTVLRF